MNDSGIQFTIFTPTFNREKTLSRVYESLINQTTINFIWLIIDDGSTDGTRSLVNNFKNENKLKIEYHYKNNGGKHTAMLYGYKLATTKYFISLDSDDELMPDAIETFQYHWEKIESAGLEDTFAEVSALTLKPDKSLVGRFHFPPNTEYLDSNWHEMVLKNNNNNEHIVCWNLSKLVNSIAISDNFWLSDKVNYLGESVLWARLGKVYSTRYINKPLRIYHTDGGESLLRSRNKKRGFYNNLVSTKYFLDENIEYFFWNPNYFTHLILKFIVSGIELKFSPGQVLKVIESKKLKYVYFLFFPAGVVLWIYFRLNKKDFWF